MLRLVRIPEPETRVDDYPHELSGGMLFTGYNACLRVVAIIKTLNSTMTEKQKRPRGRPVEKPLPEPIDAAPEDVMRVILSTPPRKDEDWRYQREADD